MNRRSNVLLVFLGWSVLGAIEMSWHTSAVLDAPPSDSHPYTIFRFILFATAFLAGLVTPSLNSRPLDGTSLLRHCLLVSLSLFLLQPVIALKVLPPDPLLPLGMAIVAVICVFGTFCGGCTRVLIRAVIAQFLEHK